MDYEKNTLPDYVVALHYDLEIDTNMSPDEHEYSGTVAITLDIKKEGLNSITLHSKELTYKECIIGNQKASDIVVDAKKLTATFVFSNAISKGENVMKIDFSGIHNDQMNGFYRSLYTDSAGEKRKMLSTQFEATDARRCFPCIDEPAAKATFATTLIVDKNLTALSNMPVLSEKSVGSSKKAVKFRVSPKMSTYLLAFCVGEFEFIEHEKTTKNGTQLRVYTTPGQIEKGRFALDVGVKALDIYDDTFGIKFPLPKMDMIAIPEFAAGAMENWGLVTYREADLLISEDSSVSHRQRVAIVVTHELAHQWFGNLVTMQWWDDLWLNEGFASWMEHYCADLIFPEWKLWDQFVVDAQAAARRLDSLKSSHPVQVPIPDSEKVDEIFDAISYCKGACVIQTVYAYIGKDSFFKGLQIYMQRHQYGNTVTKDLCAAWGEASGLGSKVFDIVQSWTGQKGYPVLTVEKLTEEKGSVKVEYNQEWYLHDMSPTDKRSWIIPVFAQTADKVVEVGAISDPKGSFVVKGGTSTFLKLNASQQVMMITNYPQEVWESMYKTLAKDFKCLEDADKAGILLDLRALVTTKRVAPELLLQFLDSFKEADTYVVFEAMLLAMGTISAGLKENTELTEAFNKFGASLILPMFKKLGWEKKENEGHLETMLRGLLFGQLTKYASKDKDILLEAKARFDAYIKDPNGEEGKSSLPTDYRSAVFKLLLKQEPKESNPVYEALMALEPKLEDSIEKKRILTCIGSVTDPAKKTEVLDWVTKEVKIQDFFYGMAGVSGSGKEGKELTWEYLKTNFDRIFERIKTANLSITEAVIIVCSRGFSTLEKAEEIEKFFTEKKVRAVETVKQVVEGTKANAKALENAIFLKSKEVALFLDKYKA